ncbi:MAG: cytochrome c maturation protein CcmE [Gammaproteobacteria bacterium]|nr:MAG: cytochrome c maturation protein CcmE [Gammaproteobacteria bacterium]
MKRRQKRMLAVTMILAGVGLAVALALQAFKENLLFFYSPTQVLAGEPPQGRKIRLGGLVATGSVRREPGELEVLFDVTDNSNTLTVHYSGVLPDLFREGQGVIAHGVLRPDGSFEADEVLAKHDENYMPPEVAEMLAEQGHPVDGARAN